MNKLKIKESYLILLIVLSLVSLGIYTTYALFTASTTINDVVGITATLDIGKSMSEYEVVTVPAGETKLIELNVVNSYNGNIYFLSSIFPYIFLLLGKKQCQFLIYAIHYIRYEKEVKYLCIITEDIAVDQLDLVAV